MADQPTERVVALWRTITGTLLAILTALAIAGGRFAFDTATSLIAIQRDFVAMAQIDQQQWDAINKNEAKLDRIHERLRALERGNHE